jgi:hypothetical protein
MSDGSTFGIEGVSGLVELGRTPAAITYRGVDRAGKTVIVKVLQRDASPEVRSRFDYDQARLGELVSHPDIVETVGHGYTAGNQPYLVMEEIGGGSLADKVGSGMDGPGVLAIGIKLAGALESAHRRNLVHGDLRPEDVLVTDDGEPHISDLGVALVTGYGPDRATEAARIAHAAPEQLDTHLPTPATDLYALGSVLHALLAGRPAFVRPGDSSAMAVAVRIANEPAPDLRSAGVPGAVIDVIDRAMRKNPAERWESAEAMGHALQQAEVSLGLPITPMTVLGADLNPPRPADDAADTTIQAAVATAPAKAGRSKVPLLAGLGVAAVAVVAGVLLLGGGDDEPDAPPITRAPSPDFDLVDVADDDGIITLSVLEKWEQVDGRNINFGNGVETPDIVAAEDSDGFLESGGFSISGIEVTVLDTDGLVAGGFPVEAEGLLEERVDSRNLANQCNTDRAPEADDVAGFEGFRQRFDGCDGNALLLFAGFDDEGRGLVVEAHLVDDDDEAAIEDVLDSIAVA